MMVGPALFLLGLGFMTSGGFWQFILKTSRLQHASERCNYRMKSLTRLFQPFLAPMAYITIALMNGDFFVCSSLGSLSASCYSNIPDKNVLQQVRKTDCLCGNFEEQCSPPTVALSRCRARTSGNCRSLDNRQFPMERNSAVKMNNTHDTDTIKPDTQHLT